MILAYTGQSTKMEQDHPSLLLSYTLMEGRGLVCADRFIRCQGAIMGICDAFFCADSQSHIDSIIKAFRHRGFSALFLDFKQVDTARCGFLKALDQRLLSEKIVFYIGAEWREHCPNGVPVFSSGVFGGDFSAYFKGVKAQHGVVAVELAPLALDFCVGPSENEKKVIDYQAALDCLNKHDALPFFSPQLCCHYFTYIDSRGGGHLVLYDDRHSLIEKQATLSRLGIETIFMLHGEYSAYL